MFWEVNSVDDLKFLVSVCCRYFNVLYFFSWPDQKLHVLPVKTNRSLHHTTLHVSRGHVNACSLWSLQPSPRPKNLTTFLLFRRGIYWTKKHFPSWFLQSRSLDDGRVSALGPALCPLKHMLKGSNTRSRTPTNPTNSLCLFFLFYFFLPLLQIIYHKI